MKIGLIGFGRSGRAVAEEILSNQDVVLEWVLRKSHIDVGEYASELLGYEGNEGAIHCVDIINLESFFSDNPVDVIIDFSSSSGVDIYDKAAKEGTRIVSAISNYSKDSLGKLEELGKFTAVLHSPNITLGINILMAISKLLQHIVPDVDIEIVEQHFREKKDVSGTAIRIARELNLDEQRQVHSVRVGEIIGKHEVIFGLPYQTIRIIHESLERRAFGQGALFAARWINDKPNGFYTMEQALGIASQIGNCFT